MNAATLARRLCDDYVFQRQALMRPRAMLAVIAVDRRVLRETAHLLDEETCASVNCARAALFALLSVATQHRGGLS